MGSDLHIYGGFTLSPYLAMRVFEVVGEISSQNVDPTLSHIDDDTCEICRKATPQPAVPDEPAAPPPEGTPGQQFDVAA
jgi:hypothetical protein